MIEFIYENLPRIIAGGMTGIIIIAPFAAIIFRAFSPTCNQASLIRINRRQKAAEFIDTIELDTIPNIEKRITAIEEQLKKLKAK